MLFSYMPLGGDEGSRTDTIRRVSSQKNQNSLTFSWRNYSFVCCSNKWKIDKGGWCCVCVKVGELGKGEQTSKPLLPCSWRGQRASDGEDTKLRLLIEELQREEREKSKEMKLCRFSPPCCWHRRGRKVGWGEGQHQSKMKGGVWTKQSHDSLILGTKPSLTEVS